MPTEQAVLHMASPWLLEAVETATEVSIGMPGGGAATVRIIGAAAFLATKWAAHGDRGNNDLLISHDVEDIVTVVTVVAGRESIVDDVLAAPPSVRDFVAHSTRAFLDHADAEVALEDAVPDVRKLPSLRATLKSRLRGIASADRPATR